MCLCNRMLMALKCSKERGKNPTGASIGVVFEMLHS